MDNITRMNIVDIDLNCGNLHRAWLNHTIGKADAKANAFGVRIFRDGEAINLTGGAVQGFFRNSQGQNIALTSHGTISGNTAYVTLPQACYNYDGQFTLAIKVINNGDGITGTMRIVDGMVDNTNVDSAVAPTGAVPTYQEVLAVYDSMVETLEDYQETVEAQDAKIDEIESALHLVTEKHNLVDPAILTASNNTKIVNNGDGTYTLPTNDYGYSIFGEQVTLDPGYYIIYGTQQGYSFLSTTPNSSNIISGTKNEDGAEKVIYIAQAVSCYLGFRITSNPTIKFMIAPFIEKATKENITTKINGSGTWYVNGSTGSDDNTGLSASTAFKTIQKAIDAIGSQNNDTPTSSADVCAAIISVTPGTYDKFVIDGKTVKIQSSGTITIAPSSGTGVMLKNGAKMIASCPFVITQSNNSYSLFITNNSWAKFTNTLTITNTGTSISILCANGSVLLCGDVLSITALSTANQCVYAQYSSQIILIASGNTISSAKTALYAYGGAQIDIVNSLTISSDATTGLDANGSIIRYNAITNNATTKETTSNGGMILTATDTLVGSKGTVDAGTDLNDIRYSGIYKLRGIYTNAPDISDTYYGTSGAVNGTLFVINPAGTNNAQYIVQIIYCAYPFATFYRIYNSSTWYRWNSFGGSVFGDLADGVDLNNVRDTGLYSLDPTTYSYTNYPLGVYTKSLLYVVRGHVDTDTVLQILYPKDNGTAPLFRFSAYNNNAWVPFGIDIDTSIKVRKYTHQNFYPITYNPQTAIKLKVGTFNIGHFNYGDSDYFGIKTGEYDMKLHNWRQFLCREQFDILNINEFVPYIDYLARADELTGTKPTTTYLLKPQFMYLDSTMDTARKDAVIASKYAISDAAEYTLNGTSGMNTGYCRYHKVTIDENHIIGVYGIQFPYVASGQYNPDSAESIANRLALLASLKTVVDSHNDTYVIIMGDFNTATETDYTNMSTFGEDNSLLLCNGGYLDWERTHNNYNSCLDNILVSANIHINNFESLRDWYGPLSSDHYAISAEVILP